MGLTELLSSGGTWGLLKIMFLFGMGIYIVFAFIVLKQITHMNKTLKFGLEGPITLLGVVHFLAAIGLFVLAFLVL